MSWPTHQKILVKMPIDIQKKIPTMGISMAKVEKIVSGTIKSSDAEDFNYGEFPINFPTISVRI